MKHLEVTAEDASITGWLHSCQGLQTKVRKILDTTSLCLFFCFGMC